MGDVMKGTCEVCKKENVGLTRKYWHYELKCECHSPQHFEMIEYCDECKTIVHQFEPEFTKISIKGRGEDQFVKTILPTKALICKDRASYRDAAVCEDGSVYYNPEKMRHDAEELEACMMAMDKEGVPREDENGNPYSLFGRVLQMNKKLDTNNVVTKPIRGLTTGIKFVDDASFIMGNDDNGFKFPDKVNTTLFNRCALHGSWAPYLLEEVYKSISEIAKVDKDSIKLAMKLDDDLGMDSLDFVELCVVLDNSLDKRLNLDFDDQSFSFQELTVEKLIEEIQKLIKYKP